MAADRDSPAGEFKRVLTIAMKTIAEDPEVTVAFGSEQPSLAGNRAKLPNVADTLKPDEMAELRRLVGAHHKFTNILRGYIANGEIAARQLAEAVKRESAIKRATRHWRTGT